MMHLAFALCSKLTHGRQSTWLCVTFISFAICGCQTDDLLNSEIIFDHPPVIVGEVDSIEHDFDVLNNSKTPLKILEMKPSCSCTKSELTTRTIAPGDRAKLKVAVSLPKTNGERVVIVTLHTDAPKFPSLRFKLRVQVYADAQFEEPTIDLGIINSEAHTEINKSLNVKFHQRKGGKEPKIISLQCDPSSGLKLFPDSNAKSTPINDNIERHDYTMQMKLAPHNNLTAGYYAYPIKLTTSDGRFAETKIVWRVTNPIEVGPRFAHFGLVKPNGGVQKAIVRLKCQTERTFSIIPTPPDASHNGIQLSINGDNLDKNKTSHVIIITLHVDLMPDPPKSLSGELLVKTNLEEFQDVKIPWSAFIGE